MTLLTLWLVPTVGGFLTLLTLLPIIGVRARERPLIGNPSEASVNGSPLGGTDA